MFYTQSTGAVISGRYASHTSKSDDKRFVSQLARHYRTDKIQVNQEPDDTQLENQKSHIFQTFKII